MTSQLMGGGGVVVGPGGWGQGVGASGAFVAGVGHDVWRQDGRSWGQIREN